MLTTPVSRMTEPRPQSRPPARKPRGGQTARPATGSPGTRSTASRGSRRGRRSKGGTAPLQLTSLPTHRGAYAETRRWLLELHGPVCAYCARRTDPADITLDHVTPRRGQSAYDRRDNLVLACERCNGSKADAPLLAFLLAQRARAANLLRFGMHLSPMLREIAEQVAGPEAAARAIRLADPDYPYAD